MNNNLPSLSFSPGICGCHQQLLSRRDPRPILAPILRHCQSTMLHVPGRLCVLCFDGHVHFKPSHVSILLAGHRPILQLTHPCLRPVLEPRYCHFGWTGARLFTAHWSYELLFSFNSRESAFYDSFQLFFFNCFFLFFSFILHFFFKHGLYLFILAS